MCRLHVVSTNVGGISEVLPPEMIELGAPNRTSMLDALDRGIQKVRTGSTLSACEMHARLSRCYNWMAVAVRTERVYNACLGCPVRDSTVQLSAEWDRARQGADKVESPAAPSPVPLGDLAPVPLGNLARKYSWRQRFARMYTVNGTVKYIFMLGLLFDYLFVALLLWFRPFQVCGPRKFHELHSPCIS